MGPSPFPLLPSLDCYYCLALLYVPWILKSETSDRFRPSLLRAQLMIVEWSKAGESSLITKAAENRQNHLSWAMVISYFSSTQLACPLEFSQLKGLPASLPLQNRIPLLTPRKPLIKCLGWECPLLFSSYKSRSLKVPCTTSREIRLAPKALQILSSQRASTPDTRRIHIVPIMGC